MRALFAIDCQSAAVWKKHQTNPCQKCDGHYLEGQGDLVSGLIMGITRVTIWVRGVITLPTKSP